MISKESWKKIAVVSIFAIAMGFLEAVVVVYLRKLYYPSGFNFPLSTLINTQVLNIEWIREFFTLVMLACIGWLAARKFSERFAYFLYAFAIWDIFYYIWLLATLGWPKSLLTWDLLFLIPFPWAGPVLAPIINSLTMILFAGLIINISDRKNIRIKLDEWIMLFLGGFIILYTYLIDYGKLVFAFPNFLNLTTNQEFLSLVSNYVPQHYNWILFIIGEAIILFAILKFYTRSKKV
jgi:hypothetical protein